MISVNPNESIYFDMYRWGLRQIPIGDIEAACARVGKDIRQKDYENYYRGYNKSAIRDPKFLLKIGTPNYSVPVEKLNHSLSSLPDNPLIDNPVQARWVPCSESNKPLIKWSQGCLMRDDALAYRNQVYLAENLRNSEYIVIDCDADHDPTHLDLQTMFFLWQYSDITHCLTKNKLVKEYDGYELSKCEIPASFHLTFKTSKLLPTIHCPWAHIDILGNQGNQLRYLKTKSWNGREPAELTENIWDEIRHYVKRRRIIH